MVERQRLSFAEKDWKVAAADSKASNLDGHVTLQKASEGIGRWIELSDDSLVGRKVTLKVEAKPASDCNSMLIFEHLGGFSLAQIMSDGRRFKLFRAENVLMEQTSSGYLRIELSWQNFGKKIFMGTLPNDTRNPPDAKGAEWHVRKLTVEVGDTINIPDEEKLVFLDVGARNGVSPHVARLGANIFPILFEPDTKEAARVKIIESQWFNRIEVLPYALGDEEGRKKLYITKAPTCSSLRKPNIDVISRFPRRDIFSLVGEDTIDCRRYDKLHSSGKAPKPDYIKIDVQGFEYEVLQGFGDLLQDVIGIELECHTYEIYEGQKLFGDIISLLDKYGLSLRALKPQNARTVFGGEICEFNAWFLKREGNWLKSEGRHKKMELAKFLIPK